MATVLRATLKQTSGDTLKRRVQASPRVYIILSQWATFMRDTLRSYPSQGGRGSTQWVSEKQRRYVMMRIRQGIIKVPYGRTGKLGQGWVIQLSASPARADVINQVAYAQFVQGASQARRSTNMRFRGWTSYSRLAQANNSRAQQAIIRAIHGDGTASFQGIRVV